MVELNSPHSARNISEAAAFSRGTEARTARPALSTDYVAPAGELEEALASLWQDLLGIEPIGADDLFFELGGNSLGMMQMNVRLRSQFGASLPMWELFENPTVTALAEKIEAVRSRSLEGFEELSL